MCLWPSGLGGVSRRRPQKMPKKRSFRFFAIPKKGFGLRPDRRSKEWWSVRVLSQRLGKSQHSLICFLPCQTKALRTKPLEAAGCQSPAWPKPRCSTLLVWSRAAACQELGAQNAEKENVKKKMVPDRFSKQCIKML